MNTPKTPIRVIDQQETPAQAEARERLNRLHVEQAGLLAQLLQEEVLPAYAVTVMIELGLVTLHDDLLPCQAGQRYTHWVEHQDAVDAYRERLRNPVPPPEGPGPGPGASVKEYEDYYRQLREHQNQPPKTDEVMCPIQCLAYEDEAPPSPCVLAREGQRYGRAYEKDPEKRQALDDPADPVNALQLHPCAVMGRSLRAALLYPVCRNRQEAEERRWAHGKPQA